MVKVRVPATTANLGPGYDVLGLALELYNFVELEKAGKLSIEIEGEGADSLPKDESNIAYQAAQEVFKAVNGKPSTIHLKLINGIPLARGLGSSAAARIGAIKAANELVGGKLTSEKILNLAVQLEGHPDNVTPALVGGLTIPYLEESVYKYHKINPDPRLRIVVVIPDFEISTQKAREVCPLPDEKRFSAKDVISTSTRVALSASALSTGNYDLLPFATQDNIFHQPFREKLIPGMKKVFQAAEAAGAKGVFLSGAGPTISAFAVESTKKIGKAMEAAFNKHKINGRRIKSKYLVLNIDREGTKTE